MWIFLAFAAAIFAGITAILAKIGIRDTDSNMATAIRTVVILGFTWLMVFIVGSQNTITQINNRTLLFLVLSGLATGGSWLCYFKALQLGDVNKVTHRQIKHSADHHSFVYISGRNGHHFQADRNDCDWRRNTDDDYQKKYFPRASPS